MKKYTTSSIFLLSVLSGCAQWPEPTKHIYFRESAVENQNNKTLGQLLLIIENRLNLLTTSDAKTCIPGQIEQAQIMLRDIKKKQKINFKNPLQKEIAILLEHLDHSHQLYEQISKKSLCGSITEQKNNDNHLSDFINCNCSQTDNQGNLTSGFKKRIDHFIKKISQFNHNIHISLYTAKKKNYLLPTYHYLIDRGIKKSNISLHQGTRNLLKISNNTIVFQLFDTSNKKITRIKDWNSHYNIQSAILEHQNEPIR
ncbi:hypothetical protein CI610_00072 [invertebrate metagenome]|uniref:Lipoprotein n=1 Tax=invertebrate metagenome TaxID=1711999 RepID=A0A2H9TCH4_9ZZZZ